MASCFCVRCQVVPSSRGRVRERAWRWPTGWLWRSRARLSCYKPFQDERRGWHVAARDPHGLLQHQPRLLESALLVCMHRRQGLTARDLLADLRVQDHAYCEIDGITFSLAASAEQRAR